MSDLKNNLQHVIDELKGLEERARKLKNQNLADIAASAHNRVKQLSDHPDLELADERKDQEANPDGTLKSGASGPKTRDEAIERMRAEGDADPEGTARMNWPYLFDLAPFVSKNLGATDDRTELNADGTLRQKPSPQPRSMQERQQF